MAAMASEIAERQRRKGKLEAMRARGVEPFSTYRPQRRNLVVDVVHGGDTVTDTSLFRLAGRVIKRRKGGGGVSLGLRDRSGSILLLVPRDRRACADVHDCDIGDIISVIGTPRSTTSDNTGLLVTSGKLLAKATKLNYGLLQDGVLNRSEEMRLMESEEHRSMFATRSAVVSTIREWLEENEFIEVETPSLEPLAGGSSAKPFLAYHHALDAEVSLRISSQLHLRRCIVGDLERVYNLGRRFRNEGISPRHSPEFTMLEWSMAYSNYENAASMVESIVVHAAKQVLGSTQIDFAGQRIDLEPPWRRISLREAVQNQTNLDIVTAPEERLGEGLSEQTISWADAVQRLYADQIESNLIQPTIVFDFPLDMHPCQAVSASDERLGESFDIVIGGMEIASGGTELNDPEEQLRRFVEQRSRRSEEEIIEPLPADQQYVNALLFGAPPSSGAGIGIDRLMMILLNHCAIAEVMPFSSAR